MKKQKLGLNDFEALETKELLEVKGGYRPHVFHSRHAILAEGGGSGGGGGIVGRTGGCAEGDPDPFGGTYSMNEVTVYGTENPDRVWAVCALCETNNNENMLPRKNRTPLFNWLIQQSGHTSGCREEYRNTYSPR